MLLYWYRSGWPGLNNKAAEYKNVAQKWKGSFHSITEDFEPISKMAQRTAKFKQKLNSQSGP